MKKARKTSDKITLSEEKNNPSKASEDLEKFPDSSFETLGISNGILNALKNLHLNIPTPIQSQAIPAALSGSDLIGIAQTGTGKTLAFGVPMIQKLGLEKGRGLVIVPTRELAMQVTESLKKLGLPLGLKLATLIGGEFIDRQLFMLRKNPHIIIATPGRLLDHLKRKTVKLNEIKVLVLDEADMMFDLGFAPQIEEILKQSPAEKQTMLFSATMPPAIARLASKYLKIPINIEVAPQGTTAEKVEQTIFIIKPSDRFNHLEKIIKDHLGSILVFVRTKRSVREVTEKLITLNHKATEIHSNLSLSRRKRALEDFKSRRARILVATDVAARGLDINGIELVINYNLPDATADYVHRIGRTGRAGKAGKAISLATPNQLKDIRDIERLINKSVNIKEFTRLESANRESTKRPSFSDIRRNRNKSFNKNNSDNSGSSKSDQYKQRKKTSFNSRPKFQSNHNRNRFIDRKKITTS